MAAKNKVSTEEKARRCVLAECPLAGQGDERCAKCTGPLAWTENGRRRGAYGTATHRSCHNCPMNGKGLPVCWCGCDGPRLDCSRDGQNMVLLGGMPDAEKFIGANEAIDAKLARLPSADFLTRLTPEAETAVLELVRIFVGLTESEVLNIHAYLKAGSVTGAGKERGVSKQAVSASAARIVKRFPELRPFLFVGERR